MTPFFEVNSPAEAGAEVPSSSAHPFPPLPCSLVVINKVFLVISRGCELKKCSLFSNTKGKFFVMHLNSDYVSTKFSCLMYFVQNTLISNIIFLFLHKIIN